MENILEHPRNGGKSEPSTRVFGDLVAFDVPPAAAATFTTAYTILEAGPGRASPAKTFGVSEDGRPIVTQHGGQPAAGTVRRVAANGSAGQILRELGDMLNDMPSRQALVCAAPLGLQGVRPFGTQKEAAERDDLISRTAANFPAPIGPALFGLDLDIKGWPAELLAKVSAFPGQLSGVLASVAPVFEHAAGLVRPSSSVGVRNRETGQTTDARAGQHRFYVATTGRDIERAISALHERLILAGWAYGFVHETGFVEVRSLIDRNASSASERLWFEGRVQLDDSRLELVPDGRRAILKNEAGGAVDLSTISDLSADERIRFDVACEAVKAALRTEADAKRAAWRQARKAALVARGTDPLKADKAVGLAVEHHTLTDDFEISFDDGTAATVSEILADPMRFHKRTGPDPLEPDYGGGRNKAVLFGDARPVRIESQAHGGIRYTLTEILRFFEPEARPATTNSLFADVLFPTTPEPLDIFGDADPAVLGDPPAGSMPAVIERWARSEARRKGVQVSFPAVAAAAVLASAVGSSLKIRVRQHDDWSEPASLWAVLVAPPGSAKTPVINAAAGPLRKLDSEWLKADGPIHAEWVKVSRRQKKDAPPLGPEPRVRRATVDDVTAERLVGIFADNPNGLLRDTDELAGVLGSLGQYKKGADGDRSQLLRLFDGGSISRDRQTAGSVYAETALLGILAGSQPQKIQALVKDMGADGLLQRFLFVLDDGLERRGIDEAPDREAAAAYERTVRGLKTAGYSFAEPLRLTADAAAALRAGSERLDGLRHLPGAGPAFQDHVAKWGKFLPRLVLTFHAVEAFDSAGRVDPFASIELATVRMAIRFADFLMLHSIKFYESFFGTPDEVSEARWVAGHLLTKPDLREIGRRDIYDARKSLRGPNYRPLLAAMSELEAAGWVEAIKHESDGPTRWSVNPRIHERFAARADRETRERLDRHARILAAGRERRRLSGEADAAPISPRFLSSVFD